MKATAHHGVRHKHASHKHAGTRKHTSAHKSPRPKGVHTGPIQVAKAPTHHKPRKLTPDGSVALCSARAVAESLRLALGVTVSDEDVLGLYWRTAADPDVGATILETLEAASASGLAGVRPDSFAALLAPTFGPPLGEPAGQAPGANSGEEGEREAPGHAGQGTSTILGLEALRRVRRSAFETDFPAALSAPWDPAASSLSLVLGLELPEGPHTVLDDGLAWWSWGEPYDPADFPGAVIEEAWTVRWAA